MLGKQSNVKIIGIGNIGKIHFLAALLNPKIKRIEVVDIDTQKLEKYKKVNFKQPFNIHIKKPDLLIIATPTITHKRIIESYGNSAEVILCEKPVCSNRQELLNISKDLAKKIYGNYAWRLLPIVQKIKKDPPKKIKITYFTTQRFHKNIDIREIICHPLDVLYYIFPESITFQHKKEEKNITEYAFMTKDDRDVKIILRYGNNDQILFEYPSKKGNKKERILDSLDINGSKTNRWFYLTTQAHHSLIKSTARTVLPDYNELQSIHKAMEEIIV